MADESSAAVVDEDFEDTSPPLQMGSRFESDSEMDITPMIDVTFLLLIFFLVASKMDTPQAVKLPKASGDPISSKNSVVIVIRNAGKDKVSVHQGDGQLFTEGDKKRQEQEVTDYVEAGLRGAEPFSGKKLHVLLKAERGIKHKEVARISKAIGRAKMSDEVTVETVFIAVKSN